MGGLTAWKGLDPLALAEAGVTEVGNLVRVPYRLPDGSERNAKLFAPDGRSWWEKRGRELLPFGLELLPGRAFAKRCVCFLTEGESDALAARQAWWNAGPVALVLGIPGAHSWRPAWRRYLEPFPVIYALADGDDAGRSLNAAIKRDVPWTRPVALPEAEDVRSLLQARGERALDPYLAEADADARVLAAVALAPDLSSCRELLGGEAVAA